MSNSEKLSLIEGQFSPEDAKLILINIFLTKINYHELRNLSSKEKFGEEDPFASKRISELKGSIDKMLHLFKDAELKKKKLTITSEIVISISDS
jgi:hypothetical protein